MICRRNRFIASSLSDTELYLQSERQHYFGLLVLYYEPRGSDCFAHCLTQFGKKSQTRDNSFKAS
jgi:hypothetical protein